jgi:hypothetical protein
MYHYISNSHIKCSTLAASAMNPLKNSSGPVFEDGGECARYMCVYTHVILHFSIATNWNFFSSVSSQNARKRLAHIKNERLSRADASGGVRAGALGNASYSSFREEQVEERDFFEADAGETFRPRGRARQRVGPLCSSR